MKKSAFTRRLATYLFFLLSTWCVAKDAAKEIPPACRPVVVEVFGYAMSGQDQSIASVHREALEAALKNAVLQAHVSLEVKVKHEGMRLKERQLRLRSAGSVEHARLIDAAFLPNTEPPIYRVHMEVSVLPLPSAPVTSPRPDWRNPRVALVVTSKHGPLHNNPFQKALTASLQDCGIQVVTAENKPATLIANVTLAGSTNPAISELRWEIRRESPFSPEESYEADVLRGEWLMLGDTPFSSLEMDKLGVMMAQDALRLWLSPLPLPDRPADGESRKAFK